MLKVGNVTIKLEIIEKDKEQVSEILGDLASNQKNQPPWHAGRRYRHRLVVTHPHLQGESPLSELELEGLHVFEAKCQSCHSGILFTDESYRNNGIDTVFTDKGRARITAFDGDIGKFRVPSLRNVAITKPYMHNAKFGSLEEVLEHYSSGIRPSPSLDPSLQNGIPLTENEKKTLIAFLKTLTDKDFTQDERFFKR